MYPPTLLRAAAFLSRISEAAEKNYAIRIRLASKAGKLIDNFIADEIRAAQYDEPIDSPYHLSWTEIGKLLEISRSAAFARYKKEKDSERV